MSQSEASPTGVAQDADVYVIPENPTKLTGWIPRKGLTGADFESKLIFTCNSIIFFVCKQPDLHYTLS